MKLSAPLKRMLDALACAHAGEFMNDREKFRLLTNAPSTPVVYPQVKTAVAARPQVGLYLGNDLPKEIMQYAMQTCERLGHGLTVFTFQSDTETEELLAPYRSALDAVGIDLRLVSLTGEPLAPLSHALRRRPEIAFLVCNESGYLGNGLLNGRVSRDSLPIPVVLVAGNDSDAPAQSTARESARVA